MSLGRAREDILIGEMEGGKSGPSGSYRSLLRKEADRRRWGEGWGW